jgi:electron transport complex protein RnfD
MENKFLVTFSPHVRDELRTEKIMLYVIYAMLPAVAVSIYFFGFYAAKTYLLSILFCLGFEAVFQKIRGRNITIRDNSALVTAILLAMNLPPVSPWWMILIGSFIAIILGKMVYGGLGQNPFNPALVARVFLLISWPAQMTNWTMPNPVTKGFIFDAVSTATPLGAAKTEIMTFGHIKTSEGLNTLNLFLGNMGGSLGEISAIALILGGLFLLWKRIISWHIPLSFIGAFLIVVVPYWLFVPEKTLNPVIHLLSGGIILGAFFMATDMVTSPVTKKGQLIFGAGCGFLTAIIRLWGGYPEGVSFAILIMNAFVPLIDFNLRPKSFGELKNEK